MKKEKEEFKVISPRAIIIGLISVILTTTLSITTQYLSPYPTKGEWLCTFVWPEGNAYTRVNRCYWHGPLIIAVFPLVINLLLPKRWKLKSWELAFVWSMIVTAPALLACSTGDAGLRKTILATKGALTSVTTRDYFINYASPLFGPKDLALLRPMELGGAVVPWSGWLLPIIWWIFFYLSFFCCLIFLAGLLRKLWVEVEFLSFPLASFAANLIDNTAADKAGREGSWFKSAYFWIGFAIAFLSFTCMQFDVLTGLSKIKILYDLTPLGITTWSFALVFDPLAFGLAMFQPDAVIVTGFVSYVLMFIILPPLVWVPLRFIEPLPPGRDNWWTFNRFIGKFEFYTATPLRGGYMGFAWGILLGLAILPLFTHWRYFRRIFAGIIGRKVEGEETEPLPYRYLWWGLIISAIAFIGALVAVNVPVHYGLIEFIYLIVFYAGLMRWQAETGWGCSSHGGWGEWMTMPLQYVAFPLGISENPNACISWMATGHMLVDNGNWSGMGVNHSNIGGWSLDSYSLGKHTQASNKHLTLWFSISVVLVLIIAFPLWLWFSYAIGNVTARLSEASDMIWLFSYEVSVQKTIHNPIWWPNASMIGNYIFGIVFVFLMYYLKVTPGGIFNYASAAAILMSLQAGNHAWIAWMVAWLIKMITRKIGGTPLLNKVAVPIGAGMLIAGVAFTPLVVGVNWILFGRK